MGELGLTLLIGTLCVAIAIAIGDKALHKCGLASHALMGHCSWVTARSAARLVCATVRVTQVSCLVDD